MSVELGLRLLHEKRGRDPSRLGQSGEHVEGVAPGPTGQGEVLIGDGVVPSTQVRIGWPAALATVVPRDRHDAHVHDDGVFLAA